jgi:predicted aspartyl protease
VASYNHTMERLAKHGAHISVRLSGLATPWVEVTALIDTGATVTLITSVLAEQLALTATGSGKISTVTQESVECPLYRVRLLFSEATVHDLTVYAAPWQRELYQCIIGRDVLKHGVLVYNGLTNTFSLNF